MEQLKISDQHKKLLGNVTESLKDIYREELVSLVIYGSAASGEFVERHSNLNLLAVLKNTGLETIKKSSRLARKFRMANLVFLTEEYIAGSTDIFPIEFLDMRENYFVLYGKDVLKEIQIDPRNLRFQCEYELKSKLLRLRQAYLMLHNNKTALKNLLFSSFTSILHIARNMLRLKGKKPPYLKDDIIRELGAEFKIDMPSWEKILSAKRKRIKIGGNEIEQLFINFVKELELITSIVDKL